MLFLINLLGNLHPHRFTKVFCTYHKSIFNSLYQFLKIFTQKMKETQFPSPPKTNTNLQSLMDGNYHTEYKKMLSYE